MTLLGVVPTTSAADAGSGADFAEVLLERHYVEDGNEIDLAVTRGADGTLLSEATLHDPTNGDEVDVWTDGVTVWWSGTEDGEPVQGELPASEFVNLDNTQAFICLHPIGALICLGGAAILFSGCGYGFGCDGGRPTTNPPESSGGSGGGGGGDHEEEGRTDGGDGDE